ncbi:MAG: asparagine synthase (glutamine-hydrolyzing) [Candidatus Latescibacteria bacterium]|nr:asparagine synthase (glutamine-hydrolyzing) [Candidatus Latescibacterota bacterium]
MCGICGQYNYKNNEPVDENTIKLMAQSIAHRGPDDEGFYISGSIGLGFRRLSIIDLAGGHQPMTDTQKIVWVVFNGEIYNFPELKKELESYGHIFKTRSDTEVIVNGYLQWGTQVFEHLNGMFGLAIWDTRKKKLILARDRMGIKLVYYKIDAERVYFGSEIRSILSTGKNKPEVDPTSLNLFLRYRYTPSPLTIFKNIKKLAPGTMVTFENGSSKITRWYNYKPEPFSPMPTDKQAKEDLLDLYKAAIKRQLISDVPLGLLLSGGLDSGLLLGLMNLYGDDWPTYTVGYGQSYKNDELEDAAETARIFSAKNTTVQLSRDSFESTLPKIVSLLEEPIASSSIIPMYHVCERARQDVKVVFVGQGPDELLGGYLRHRGIRYGAYWRNLPGWIQSTFTSFINNLPRNETLKRGVYSLNTTGRMERYQQVFSIIPGNIIDSLFKDGILSDSAGDAIHDCWSDLEPLIENIDELGGFQYIEVRLSLPDELLMYADKLSMAHGLEARVPYLDQEIVEYVERLSAHYKVRNGRGKWLHRQVCKDFMPKKILQRKKRGFAVDVVDDWFRSSLTGKFDGTLMNDKSLMFDYLHPHAIKALVDEHTTGKKDNHKILFSLVVFEEWLRSIYN